MGSSVIRSLEALGLDLATASTKNLLVNSTFTQGSAHGWQPLCCSLAISDAPLHCDGATGGHQFYCVAHNRTQGWQGIAQDVSDRLKADVEYTVEAWSSIRGPVDTANVLATMKVESSRGDVNYITLASGTVSRGEWTLLKGKLHVNTLPDKALVYLEGPPGGVDLLVKSFSILPSALQQEWVVKEEKEDCEGNILVNASFDRGLEGWSGLCCKLQHAGSHGWNGFKAHSGASFAIATERKEGWQGIEQDITLLLQPNMTYTLTATVRISGFSQIAADVLASVRLERPGSNTQYLTVGRASASSTEWVRMQGKVLIDSRPEKAVLYLEGPPGGMDLLVDSVCLRPVPVTSASTVNKQIQAGNSQATDSSILCNPVFANGFQNWAAKGCKASVCERLENPTVVPYVGKFFAVASNRTANWSGIEQTVTGRLEEETMYDVLAAVRVCGPGAKADVLATLCLQEADSIERYITLGRVEAGSTEWVQLQGKLLLHKTPKKASVYLEGPPPGMDLLIDSFSINPARRAPPAEPPVIEDPKFGVNIVENSNLLNGLSSWYAQGSCQIRVASGAPTFLPPAARASLPYPPHDLSGNFIIASNRTDWWEGPAQTITERLQLFVPYQVSAWVRVGPSRLSTKSGPQKVNVALSIDGRWVTGGEVEADAHSWKETVGSFRLETMPKHAMVYAQGPEPGMDLMIAGLQIFAVDRLARVALLQTEADKLRKRDMVLQLLGSDKRPLPAGVRVRIQQTSRSFPLGSCINRWSLDNKGYVKFFREHFNWAVFENEIKWGWTEPQKGQINYQDSDELVEFCNQNKIPIRGHCIFWECEHTVQDWLKSLTAIELAEAVQNRATQLLSRYHGKFQHYDVNNEMLHGCFYRDRLGPGIQAYMFKLAHQFDPEAQLFVNDYHVEDGCDANSSPERYLAQIEALQKQGALVGGIGIQGHVDTPVGSILCHSFDKLATKGIPIWLTEIDVSSSNEHVRADDLEVILRECFANSGIAGIMLWGFWEGATSRENAHLVDSDGRVNAAGKRFIALKEEWTTSIVSQICRDGEVSFRGFFGGYTAFVDFGQGEIPLDFEVTKGTGPLFCKVTL